MGRATTTKGGAAAKHAQKEAERSLTKLKGHVAIFEIEANRVGLPWLIDNSETKRPEKRQK